MDSLSEADCDKIESIMEQNPDLGALLNGERERSTENKAALIESLVKNFDGIVGLHSRLTTTTNTVKTIRTILDLYSSNLGLISSQMLAIQTQCADVSSEMKNRQLIKDQLNSIIDKIVIPERMISAISSSPINGQEFIEQLHELKGKVANMDNIKKLNTLAADQACEVVESLKIKCLQRLRHHIFEKIHQFKFDVANIETLKDDLIAHRHNIGFIRLCNEGIYDEIREYYSKTMKKIYLLHHRPYMKKLPDFIKSCAFVFDPIGDTKKKSTAEREQNFVLGNRAAILLSDLEARVIKIEQAHNKSFNAETVLRSCQFVVINAFASEYKFMRDFFDLPPSAAREELTQILDTSLALCNDVTESVVESCNDCISLILLACAISRYKFILLQQDTQILEDHFSRIDLLVWSRFEAIMSDHIESIHQHVTPSYSSYYSCHIITKRTSNLLAAFYAIVGDLEPNKLIVTFSQLLQEWESFILIEASVFDNRKQQLVYQIANYNVVLNMLSVQSHLPVKTQDAVFPYMFRGSCELCESIISDFKKKYNNFIFQMCQEQLLPFFLALMTSFKTKIFKTERDKIEEIVSISSSFYSTWKNALAVIVADLKHHFSKLYLEQEIIESCFTYLLDYYKEFTTMVESCHQSTWNDLCSRGKMVDLQQILIEMKKYR